jgi:glycerophosphoryl diester phosphodiesterase
VSCRGGHRFLGALAGARGRLLVLAHRGDSSHAPENTLEAAALGHRSGADGWEFDVQLTRDGVPVLLHDPCLLRTTDVARAFPDDPRADLGYLAAEFTLAEIRRLDAGSWFVDPAGGPRSALAFGTLDRMGAGDHEAFASGRVRVATLEEALALTADLDWLANVEIKSGHDGDFALLDAVLGVVERLGIADRVLVSSFDHVEVARAAASGLGVATGVLAAAPLYRPAEYVRRLGADAYHASASALGAGGAAYLRGRSARSLRGVDLDECRRGGVPVLAYTVNECGAEKMAGHLAEAGVAGLFTDDPRAVGGSFIPSAEHTRRRSGGAAHPADDPSGPPIAPGSR